MGNPDSVTAASRRVHSTLRFNGKTVNFVLVIVGFIIARFGARLFVVGEARGGQSNGSGVVTLLVQLVGWALVIWGLFRVFS